MKVTELKDRLRSMGLKVGGRKSQLIDRVLSGGVSGENPVLTEETVAMEYDEVPYNAVVILACKS